MVCHISRVSLYKARHILLATPICHRPRPFLTAHASLTPPQENFTGTALPLVMRALNFLPLFSLETMFQFPPAALSQFSQILALSFA